MSEGIKENETLAKKIYSFGRLPQPTSRQSVKSLGWSEFQAKLADQRM